MGGIAAEKERGIRSTQPRAFSDGAEFAVPSVSRMHGSGSLSEAPCDAFSRALYASEWSLLRAAVNDATCNRGAAPTEIYCEDAGLGRCDKAADISGRNRTGSGSDDEPERQRAHHVEKRVATERGANHKGKRKTMRYACKPPLGGERAGSRIWGCAAEGKFCAREHAEIGAQRP